jgi:hypothetical protein
MSVGFNEGELAGEGRLGIIEEKKIGSESEHGSERKREQDDAHQVSQCVTIVTQGCQDERSKYAQDRIGAGNVWITQF